MERVSDSFTKYSSNIEAKKTHEDFESYTLSFEIINIKSELEWNDLYNISSFINDRDSITLSISVNEGEPFSFSLNENCQEDFSLLDSINMIIDEESAVKIEYKVSKKNINNILSIYDLNSFYNFLNNQKLSHLLNHLHKNLDIKSLNKFEIQNDSSNDIYFQSALIIIGSHNKLQSINNSPDSELRKTVLNNRLLYTNPQIFSKFEFIPDDFNNLQTSSDELNIFTPFFNKLKIIFAASFLSNISNIKNDKDILLGIIGHKFVETTVNFNKLNIDQAQSFYPIYEWIFGSGNVHDKLDLARNIITRYISFVENKWVLPSDTLSSIQSAHAIYLKENVEKYIETKNKVAEITTELSVKSKDVAQHFISSFKNNNLTLLTYFISIFIFNSLSDNSDKKIFSEEKYFLSMVFLFVSTCYLLITRIQLHKDIKLNIKYFYYMKRIYRDIFDSKELNNLFHKRHLQYNVQNIKQTMDLFSWIWLLEIFLLSVLSIFLTYFL